MPENIWSVTVLVWLLSGLSGLAAAATKKRFLNLPLAIISMLLSSLAAGMVLGISIDLLSVIFTILVMYSGINACRIIAARLEKNNLKRTTLAAGWALLLTQFAVLATDYFWPQQVKATHWVPVLAACQLVVAVVFLLSFMRQIKLSRYRPRQLSISDRELPTLTVAIPAKNENIELEKCLESLLANDYPKLEILVLDDSAGSRTGQIINSLAHDGARFILGEEPSGRWLAKNLAYDRLFREANGELILFCGVDARFGRTSLRALVLEMLASKKKMLSVMPMNSQRPVSLVVQPMRYFWELARPRTGTSLPVLSTCWMIERRQLEKSGGFRAIRNQIVPERYFASYCSSQNDGYRLIRSNRRLEITSEKVAREQRRTAIRTRYPLLHRRLSAVAWTSLFTAFFLTGPLALVVIIPYFAWSALAEMLAAVAALIWFIIFGSILKTNFGIGIWALPVFIIAALVDMLLVNLSLLKYEFGRVIWKGRDVAAGI